METHLSKIYVDQMNMNQILCLQIRKPDQIQEILFQQIHINWIRVIRGVLIQFRQIKDQISVSKPKEPGKKTGLKTSRTLLIQIHRNHLKPQLQDF